MNIIGISGLAGAGKSTAASRLVEKHKFVEVSLADPMKRFCAEMFGWGSEVWGPSGLRNKPDERFPRKIQEAYPDANPIGVRERLGFLTPRHALQTLGSEWGRNCYQDVWIDYALRVARDVLHGHDYSPQLGLRHERWEQKPRGVVIADVRFRNEFAAIRKAGGKLWRIRRPNAGLDGPGGGHVSEQEQLTIPDSEFDVMIENEGTLEAFRCAIDVVLGEADRGRR